MTPITCHTENEGKKEHRGCDFNIDTQVYGFIAIDFISNFLNPNRNSKCQSLFS